MTNNNIPTNYSHALQILNGRMRKTIHGIRGTHLEVKDNVVVMYYHNTPVVSFHHNGDIALNSGGYKTRTTKERMNKVIGNKAKVYQHKGGWYIYYLDGNTTHAFMDGMKV